MNRKKILLVESDLVSATRFRSLLDTAQINCVSAPSAELARIYLRRVSDTEVDAIICAETLPDEKGSILAEKYRKAGGRLPFALMSSNLGAVQIADLMKERIICAHLPLPASNANILTIAMVAISYRN